MSENVTGKLQKGLNALEDPDTTSYSPTILKATDSDKILKLIDSENPILHDQIQSQVKELLKVRNPSEAHLPENLKQKFQDWSEENDISSYGVYVFYPWSKRLIHILDEQEFIELRTSRNRYKISWEEQEVLRQKTIGVIGLSVGHSITLTAITERIAGTFRIADFDHLELSNLNRIRSGLSSLGLPKTTMLAREIAEIDPFIKLEIYENGINSDNIDSFLNENGKLDLLIEVCDSLPTKISCRQKAKAIKIPVLMDTSDRGMLDIERFDLEPERSIFHGKIDQWDLENFEDLNPKKKMEVLKKLVDYENLSTEMKFSFSELGKSITSWPQLASDVILGGGITTKVARRILLGQDIKSGRYYLDNTEEI